MEPAVTGLLVEGLWLMLFGISIVFAFLLVLVGLLTLMSKVVIRWGPQDMPAEAGPGPLPPILVEDADVRTLAVISAAIARYRRQRPL